MQVLVFPVTVALPAALYPIKVLESPVVNEPAARLPTTVFWIPVVTNSPAKYPTAVLREFVAVVKF
jgi:hypothetical protein